MSLESLKQEIASLPPEGRNQLMGYLIDLRARESDPHWATRTAAALNDKSPSRWIPWEEVETKLDAKDAEEAP
ncbi:hypothetical protein EI77_02423 [Prosthecobacter fusiformis]|uniref:Addiction module component n=1 Tax=Prosthecobacter fusiformis TaxID=48464 RepID=A0A4R7RZC1_9BACT|nr:hypothetical protein [Prosthecobacter fusiformis]TDU71300.1 hypothetical protein EI77_02423 [Prosthecobacter fusiformis]